MRDRREFIKLDIGYLSNPKVAGLLVARRPFAVLLHVECMTYSRQHRTDGRVPTALALRGVIGATKRDVAACIEAGLLIDCGDGIVEVHDYLDHQESSEEIEARSEAGRIGAQARWGNAGANANRMRSAMQRREEERREEDASHLPPAPAGDEAPETSSATTHRRRPERPLPEAWTPTDRHQTYATEHHLDLTREAESFRNHAATHDRRARDWDAAFRTWLTKAKPAVAPAPEPRSAWDRLPNITEERVRRERAAAEATR